MQAFLDQWVGPDVPAGALTWTQIIVRAVVVFIFGVVLVRAADRRFLGHNAGFDVLLAVVLGSVLSRAINGQAPFFKTLGATVVLVVLHRLIGAAACRWSVFSKLIKGRPIVLVKDGLVRRREMHRADISDDDLQENLRLNANLSDVADVAEARFERNGVISVLKRKNPGGPSPG